HALADMAFLARRSRVRASVGIAGARPSAPARKIAVWRALPKPTSDVAADGSLVVIVIGRQVPGSKLLNGRKFDHPSPELGSISPHWSEIVHCDELFAPTTVASS